MKKRFAPALVFLLLSALVIGAVAAGGDASDPLASLSYLNGVYASTVDAAVNKRLDTSDAAIRSAVSGTAPTAAGSGFAAVWQESRLKERDTLSGSTGLSVLLLAGSVKLHCEAGAVVDVTTGTELANGSSLLANHRYLVAEDASASFTVTSPTAVVDYQGAYSLLSSDAVDYNAIASALKTLHLFRGSYTGYGQGYDLEVAPTRLQALIMFIRVLGEEEAALSYSGTSSFQDLEPGSNAAKYVGYAYSKGYTNGYTPTAFRPSQRVNAYQYTEFVLRALGLSSISNKDLSGTLDRAASNGVLTVGEAALLRSVSFLRAHLVYISYYALDARIAGSQATLKQSLMDRNVFTAGEAASAAALVSGPRIA